VEITGALLIGGEERQSDARFEARNPATDALLPSGTVSEASAQDVSDACARAAEAAEAFGAQAPDARAAFLEAIADAILAIGDPLVETAMAETGLPRPRIEGERMRTANQLRLFAGEVRAGRWIDATIDAALPDRTPPRPDLRRMNVPVGPVAVFGASNFPLAFSVAGGDTASALAAGCPVVVKGHPLHPGTGELVARAITDAVASCGLPAGVFSYLPGQAHALGEALVSDPRIAAVGFTGSRTGGLALARIAAARAVPIPVFAEMSAVHPVVLMPGALASRAEELGTAFVGSLNNGAGQFCTNPGLVLAIEGADLDRFLDRAARAIESASAAVMLSSGIHSAYRSGIERLDATAAARQVAAGTPADGPNRCRPALYTIAAADYAADPSLHDEVFGAVSLVVRCRDLAELTEVARALEGQLTATLQLGPDDESAAADLVPILREKAGRLLVNGWPTGVEVCHAMVHGGPFPATTHPQSTSVGTLAMMRFVRPVCFQDMPDGLLPPALKAANPWGLPRRLDGEWQDARA